MNVELLDCHQKQVATKQAIDADAVKHMLNNVSPQSDYTFVVEHENGALMYIAIDRSVQTLLFQLGEDEFYDYISSPEGQGDIEFIQGGQRVTLDKKYFAPPSATMDAIDSFAYNPGFARNNIHWQLQV